MKLLWHFGEIGVLVSNHDGLSMIEHSINVVDHKFRNVRNVVENEIPVRANQTGYIHVLVVDAQVVSLPDQSFDDLD